MTGSIAGMVGLVIVSPAAKRRDEMTGPGSPITAQTASFSKLSRESVELKFAMKLPKLEFEWTGLI